MQRLFSIDFTPDGEIARKALAGEPILIYPKGTHHRATWWDETQQVWTVDDDIVNELVVNFQERESRGLRQKLLPVNEDHSGSRALGWFTEVLALPEGVGATFKWNRHGHDALSDGQFAYFSVEIYDEIIDRETGERVPNVICGGALTNYPFFGEATTLMSRLSGNANQKFNGGDRMNETLEQVRAERDLFQRIVGFFARSPVTDSTDAPAASPALPAEFTQMQQQMQEFSAQLATVQAERDTYAERIERLQGQLHTEQDARASERFAVLAQQYAHLPGATPAALAQHLRWLHEADAEGEHREFFSQVLAAADQQLARRFSTLNLQQPADSDPQQRIEQAVVAYMQAQPGAGYRDAIDAVKAQHPDWFEGV